MQGLELLGENAVIVAAPAVAGDFGGGGIVAVGVGAVVVEGEADDGAGAGQNLANVLAFGVGHPGHVGLVALVEPALEGGGLGAGLGAGLGWVIVEVAIAATPTL